MFYVGLIFLACPAISDVLPIQDNRLNYSVTIATAFVLSWINLFVLFSLRNRENRARSWNDLIYLEDIFEYYDKYVNTEEAMRKSWYSRGLSRYVTGHEEILAMNIKQKEDLDKLIAKIVKDVGEKGTIELDGVRIRGQSSQPLVCAYSEDYLKEALNSDYKPDPPKEPSEMKRTSDTVV